MKFDRKIVAVWNGKPNVSSKKKTLENKSILHQFCKGFLSKVVYF